MASSTDSNPHSSEITSQSNSFPLGSVLIKPVGADCNLACRYCFYRPKASLYPETTRHRMSQAVLEKMTESYLAVAGPEASFAWQGGEPTLAGLEFFQQAVAIQRRLARPDQRVSNGFQTNGLLIDDDWAKFFALHNFLVGVSLDGPPQVHDHYRTDAAGGPSLQRTLEAIAILQRYGVQFNILAMVTPKNVDDPDALYDFFLSHDLRFLQFIPCVERDPESGQMAKFSVSPEAYGSFLCRLFDRWVSNVPGVYIRLFDELLTVYATGESPSCEFRPSCGDYLVVEHNGDLYACDFFVEPEWKLGNLMESPLAQIVGSERFAEFAARKSAYGDECRSCHYLHLCHGGCPKHRLVMGDSPSAPNYLCSAYRQFFSHSESGFRKLAARLRQEGVAPQVGRNDPCPCGSGKKYKHCCGKI